MIGLWTLVLRFWKIWVPALAMLLVAGTIYAQHTRIKTLKAEKTMAIVEHDKAVEEQKQLLSDIDRLNKVLKKQKTFERKLGKDLQNAKNRIRKLAEDRPEVADWRMSAIPAGLWDAAVGARSPGGNPAGVNQPDPRPVVNTHD